MCDPHYKYCRCVSSKLKTLPNSEVTLACYQSESFKYETFWRVAMNVSPFNRCRSLGIALTRSLKLRPLILFMYYRSVFGCSWALCFWSKEKPLRLLPTWTKR